MATTPHPTGVDISVIVTAHIRMPSGYVFRRPGNRFSRLRGLKPGPDALPGVCLAYVIRHPAHGVLLIDTGVHPDALQSLRHDFGVPMSLLFRGLQPSPMPFGDQLRELGIEPGDVQSVLMTHLHVDHTSGMRLLPRAVFTIARAEWNVARGRFSAGRGYVARHLPPSSRVRLLDFEHDGKPFGPFPSSIDFLGDGSIRLVLTPGHTPGHMSVLVRRADGADVVVVGDAAYTLRSIQEQRLPMLTDDDEASLESLRSLKQFAEEHPAAILVPSHDPDAWRQLKTPELVSDRCNAQSSGSVADP